MNYHLDTFTTAISNFTRWSAFQTQIEHDSADGYPLIEDLVHDACAMALMIDETYLGSRVINDLALVVSVTEESERAIAYYTKHGISTQTMAMLAAAGDWRCRWQVCAYLDSSDESTKYLLMSATWDLHPYVVRRALNALVAADSNSGIQAASRLINHADVSVSTLATDILRSGQKLLGEDED